jgi:ribosomal protein L30/L7E
MILWDKVPLVPVTLMTHVLDGAPVAVEKVRMAVAVPPGARVTLVGLIPHDGQTGAGQSGGGDVMKLTVPANPPRLPSVIVDVALDPDCTLCELGLADIVKSGGGGLTTVNLTTTLCDKLPLVAVTLMAHVVAGAAAEVVNVRMAEAVPPDVRVILVGLRLHCGQAGQSGGGVVERLTMPANPLKLDNVIVDLALDPACTFCELGLAAIEKSGVIGPPNVAV